MKLRMLSAITVCLVSVAVSPVGAAVTANGATPVVAPTDTGGISLTPAIQDKVLGPNEISTEFSVQLSNQTNRPITFSLSSTDFTTLNQTGGLAFLGSDSESVTKGHGLSSILQLESKIVTIPANNSKTIKARVADVKKLSKGGHYTAILAQALPDGTQTDGNKVAINQVVSSLLFLETAGTGTKTLRLLRPPQDNVSFSLPNRLNLAFKATGNTQSVPRGVISVLQGDNVLLHGVINESSSLLLPGSTRLFPTDLLGNRRPLRPGIYTLRVEYRYEGSLGVTTYEKKLLYVNALAIIISIIVLCLLSYAVIWSRHRKRLQRIKLRRASSLSRTPKQPRSTRKIIV